MIPRSMFLTNILTVIAVIATAVPSSGAAEAQTTSLKPFPLTGGRTTDVKKVKIAVTYQFFIEGTIATIKDQTKLADQGRKHLYLMLAKECVVLKQTIADTCAIERASVNAQLRKQSRSQSKNNGVRISASASYRIDLKKDE